MRAILYLRLSDGRSENGSFADREAKLRERAHLLGWSVARVVIENDMLNGAKSASAFKRRKVNLPNGRSELRVYRPGFRAVLDDLVAGRADALLAEDLDRTMRDPRDAEDLIDVIRARKLDADSLSGSLRFTAGGTDAEVLAARILVSVANKASADTARRVAGGRERKARHGEFGGGRRPYGFDADGVSVRPGEAAVIVDVAQRLVQGVSLRALAAELRSRDVPTVTGTPWTAQTLRDIMLRDRNAGRIVYRGEVLPDVAAPWEPIISPEVHAEVQRILVDPARRVGPGAAARWQGSGLYRCGICQHTVEVTIGGRAPRYRCSASAHLSRNAGPVDELVSAVIVERLGRDDAVDLLAPPAPSVDSAALRAERKAIRGRLNAFAADEALGLRDREEVLSASAAGKTRIAEIDATLSAAVATSPLAPFVGLTPAEIATKWANTPLATKRAVIETLVSVTIMPTGRTGRVFDPTSVVISWAGAA